MGPKIGGSHIQTGQYHTLLYAILIGVALEMLYLHYNIASKSKSNELQLQIDDLQAQHAITLQNQKHAYVHLSRDFERKLHMRVRKGIAERSQATFNSVKSLRLQIFRLISEQRRLMMLLNGDMMKREHCENVTLVCRKGERGPRGKAGPRGYKGDVGTKGDRGITGPKGQRGPQGAIGIKGQKGDAGPPGQSIEKPKIVTTAEREIIRKESSNLTLFCEASGNPRPDIRWQFDSKNIDSRYEFPGRGSLSISNINRNDTGRIVCIAENILGRDDTETRLIVHTKPKAILTSHRLSAPEGIPLEVVCTGEGVPYPKLKWRKGFGNLVAKQLSSKDSKSITLQFSQLSVSDAGHYICEAVNDIGRSESSIFLDVDYARDCSGYKGNRTSGIYTINPDGKQPFTVFCDMETAEGGWTVIQRRSDGSVDFFRNWVEYKVGFGVLEKEFWLGNDKIHRLTKRKDMMIRFDLEDFDGNKVFAEYKQFYTDGDSDNYKVHVSGYSGSAPDSFLGTSGLQFSTKDRDHDTQKAGACAVTFHGAWWYGACHASNLNGKYLKGPHKSYANGVNWYGFKGHYYSLKRTEMKVKPAEH